MAVCAALLLAAPVATAKPTAIVGLGDSFMSGESAGSNEKGTDTVYNWCHRSANAFIFKSGVKVDKVFNLSCSGAVSSDVWLKNPGSTPIGGNLLPDYEQTSQLTRLRAIAPNFDVKAVLLGVGHRPVRHQQR